MIELELEITYLAKLLPEDFLEKSTSKKIIDIYLPKSSEHPKLRIRQSGDKYEITKKEILDPNDASKQLENTIGISEAEFKALETIESKKIEKTRYFYPYNWKIAEFDIFEWDLTWLIVVDFEFKQEEEKNKFTMPEFCLIDITQEEFIAWWKICGKTYQDIIPELERLWYTKILLHNH